MSDVEAEPAGESEGPGKRLSLLADQFNSAISSAHVAIKEAVQIGGSAGAGETPREVLELDRGLADVDVFLANWHKCQIASSFVVSTLPEAVESIEESERVAKSYLMSKSKSPFQRERKTDYESVPSTAAVVDASEEFIVAVVTSGVDVRLGRGPPGVLLCLPLRTHTWVPTPR